MDKLQLENRWLSDNLCAKHLKIYTFSESGCVICERDQLKAELNETIKQACLYADNLGFQRDQLKADNVRLDALWRDTTIELIQLKAELAKVTACLERIANYVDAPDINATGDWQKGLHCGVEDKDCQDRYDGADYGHAVGVEKGLEWASNEAKTTLAAAPEPSTAHR